MYYYLDHYKDKIDGKDFLVIKIYYEDIEHHVYTVCQVYRPYKQADDNALALYSKFEELRDKIDYVMKKDGKVKLTFNL